MKNQTSISDIVFNKIEEEILSGILKKGDYISENKLAERFNVSRTPVREAIKRLEQEDLIEYENCKTVRVLGITKDDVLSVYDIRLQIEGDAMVKAAFNMTDEDYLDLSQTIDLQEFYTLKADADKVKDELSLIRKRHYDRMHSDHDDKNIKISLVYLNIILCYTDAKILLFQ